MEKGKKVKEWNGWLSHLVVRDGKQVVEIVEFDDQLRCADGKHWIDEAANADNMIDLAEVCDDEGGDITFPRFSAVRAAWSRPVKKE